MNDPSPAAEPVSEPAPAPAAEPPAEPAAVRLSVPAVLLATVASAGTLLRLAAAFLAWFATACVPYYNVGTTIGLAATAVDVARGRPVSPVELFDRRHRERIVPFFLTLGLALAATMALPMFVALVAVQFRALVAAFPGSAAAQFAANPWLRDLALLAALPAPLVVCASLSLAVPILLDTGACGLRALSLSRRLVAGNLAAVALLELVPAVLALAVARLLPLAGAGTLAILAAEGVVAVFALSLFGQLYKALRPALPADAAHGCGASAA